MKPNTPASSWVKNEASSSQLIQETPQLLLLPILTLEIQPATGPPSSNKSTQSKPASGYMKTPLLTVTLPYQHSSHLSSTTLSISRNAEVHRYNEHPRQHSSPALQTKPFSFPSSHSWEIRVQNRPRDGDEHALQPGPRSW